MLKFRLCIAKGCINERRKDVWLYHYNSLYASLKDQGKSKEVCAEHFCLPPTGSHFGATLSTGKNTQSDGQRLYKHSVKERSVSKGKQFQQNADDIYTHRSMDETQFNPYIYNLMLL